MYNRFSAKLGLTERMGEKWRFGHFGTELILSNCMSIYFTHKHNLKKSKNVKCIIGFEEQRCDFGHLREILIIHFTFGLSSSLGNWQKEAEDEL